VKSTALYPPPRHERDPAGRPCWRHAADPDAGGVRPGSWPVTVSVCCRGV